MANSNLTPDSPGFSRTAINLADPRLGARSVLSTDDFFAPVSRMLDPEPAVFIPGKYDENGKWMDGWESRRKRVTGHDFCVVKLGVAGRLLGVDIDTSHFTGNFPPAASIEACRSDDDVPGAQTRWIEVLPAVALNGNAHHFHAIEDSDIYTHIRLNIYPDGGVARLRVYGRPRRDLSRDSDVDLASAMNGARVVTANNEHYGYASNLLLPTRAANIGEGWETRRRREPGADWCIIELAAPGEIHTVEVDTAHFKGNFADRCSLQGASVTAGTDESLVTQSMFWPVLMSDKKLDMDRLHTLTPELVETVTHVRFNILPDGGVSRLRLRGRPSC